MQIDESTVSAFLETLPGLDILDAPNARFFYYDPRKDIPHDGRQPFATTVSADDYETVSNLSRPGVYRLNIGVTHATYRALFGKEPAWGKDGGVVETGHDFAQLDTFLPHPWYAPMGWICILNPSGASWPRVQAYLLEAHAEAARQYARTRRA